jgi:hypothetical protein
MNELFNKLVKIQAGVAVPKSLHNDFANFNYRSAEQILEAVKPIAAKEDCVITLSDKVVAVGTWNYVESTATLIDTESGATYSATALAREQEAKRGMDTSQVTGSTSSYARKHALGGLLALDDGRDADSMDNSKTPTRTERILSMSPLTHKKGDIVKEMYEQGITRFNDQKDVVIEILGKDTIDTEKEADQVLNYLTKDKKENVKK